MPVKTCPTQADVAKIAGVSQLAGFAKRVLNQSETVKVPKKTHQRVFDAMEQLGYVPNCSMARSLRSGQTQTIGLVVPDNSNPFFAEIARLIEDVFFQHGNSVILCNTDGDAEKESAYVDVLVAKQIDGVIFITANGSVTALKKLQESGIPYIVADRDIPDTLRGADLVMVDNQAGGYLASMSLIELGLRKIVCITGPHKTSSGDRVLGYQKALTEAGIAVDPDLIVPGDYHIEGGLAAMNRILEAGLNPDGVFACNDMMAIGAMRSIKAHGFRIPEDISVVGFDDIFLARFAKQIAVDPQLTTISQPISEIVANVTRLLFREARIQNKKDSKPDTEPQKIILQPSLRFAVRDSTRRLARSHALSLNGCEAGVIL
ncbi:MAG: LacI family DNA-binding transcriptional regulator [Chloroflexota bacterium]